MRDGGIYEFKPMKLNKQRRFIHYPSLISVIPEKFTKINKFCRIFPIFLSNDSISCIFLIQYIFSIKNYKFHEVVFFVGITRTEKDSFVVIPNNDIDRKGINKDRGNLFPQLKFAVFLVWLL